MTEKLKTHSHRITIDSERWLIKEDGQLYFCEKVDETKYIRYKTSAGEIRKALAKIGVDLSERGFERKQI